MNVLSGGRPLCVSAALVFALAACNDTRGSANASADTGTSEVGADAADPSLDAAPSGLCVAASEHTSASVSGGEARPKPMEVSGTVCAPGDEVWGLAEGNWRATRLALADPAISATVDVMLFETRENGLEALETSRGTAAFELTPESPEVLLQTAWNPAPIALRLTSPAAGDVHVVVEHFDTGPPLDPCVALYQSRWEMENIQVPPATLTGELCNSRDSRTWGLRVQPGVPVRVTLENEFSMPAMNVSAWRGTNYDEFIDGASLGMLAGTEFVFTPDTDVVTLSTNGDRSTRESFRLRVEQ